jgi:hypothetical protein
MLLTIGAGTACTLYLSWFTYMKATIFKRSLVDDKESKELFTLTKVFNDLGNIETVMRASLELKAGSDDQLAASTPLDRAAMRKMLEQEAGRSVSDDELDLIFGLYDCTSDGWIGASDYQTMGFVK